MGHLLDVYGVTPLDFCLQLGVHGAAVFLKLVVLMLQCSDDALAFPPHGLVVDALQLGPVGTQRCTSVTCPSWHSWLLLHDCEEARPALPGLHLPLDILHFIRATHSVSFTMTSGLEVP